MINSSAFQSWTGKVQRMDFKYTANGNGMASLVIRYPDRQRVKSDSGEYEFKTVSAYSPFLTCWGNGAEAMNKIVKEGMTLTVLTSYKRDSYEKDGETVYVDRFTVESWQVADWHTGKDGEEKEPAYSNSVDSDVFDADDIPF